MKQERTKQKITKAVKMALVLLLTVATLALLPQTKVEAAIGDKKALMLGKTGVDKIRNATPYDGNLNNEWDGDYLYWGKDGSTSMKWQILNKNATEFGTSGMLILSGNLGNTQFNPDSTVVDANKYEASTLDRHLNTEYTNRLSIIEKGATLDSSNTDTSGYTGFDGSTGADQVFSNKKFFAPTAKMMYNTAYGFSSTAVDDDKARQTNMSTDYWLSSRVISYSAGYVGASGELSHYDVSRVNPSRGASKINTTSLLFVSAANGGKSGSTGSALAPVGVSTNGEWKFTLKDIDQKITNHTVKRIARDKVEITLNKVGNGTSISAITTDESGSNIMHYGRVASVTSGPVNDAKVTITLPEKVINGTEKLKIFTEEYTNEKSTDYASDLYDVTIPFTPVTKIEVTSAGDKTSIVEGETLQMVASATPADATNKEVIWSVANKTRTANATIDDTGLLTATSAGAVIVTATAKDGSAIVGTKTITIKEKLVTKIEITTTDNKTSLVEGETLQMFASLTPSDATNKEVLWSVSNTGIASITPTGLLTGTGVGEMIVTATAKDGSGIVGTKTITIKERLVTKIEITTMDNKTSLLEGETLQMFANVTPMNATNKEVTWAIANQTDAAKASVITKNGLLACDVAGEVIVTATAKDGSGVVESKTMTVTKKANIVMPADPTENQKKKNMTDTGDNTNISQWMGMLLGSACIALIYATKKTKKMK